MKTSLTDFVLSRHGFTRIDFLGLTTAVVVIGALQLPLVGAGRSPSSAAICIDNYRRLALAVQMYAADNAGWLPPNSDVGTFQANHSWITGQVGPGGPEEFNSVILADPSLSLLANYLQRDVSVFHCPADAVSGPDPGNPGLVVSGARSVAMNGAVGTNPNVASGRQPVDGPWLDNSYGHTYGRTWLTYGRDSQFTRPGPALTMVLVDEDHASINDGTLAFGMVTPEWIDWPATWHDGGATLAFADAHVEVHRWIDSRTPTGGKVGRRQVPGSADYFWLRDRTSAAIAH